MQTLWVGNWVKCSMFGVLTLICSHVNGPWNCDPSRPVCFPWTRVCAPAKTKKWQRNGHRNQ